MNMFEDGSYQLFNNQLSVKLPADFHELDTETIQSLFPYEDRPEIILGADDILRFCTFSLLQEQKLNSFQVKRAIQTIKEEVTNLYPSCLLAEPKVLSLKEGTCGWFEYRTLQKDGPLHNYMYIFSVEGSMMLGTMGCALGDTEGEEAFISIMESLAIPEDRTARRGRR